MNHVKTLCFVLVAATTWADEPSDDGSVRLQLDSDQSLVFRLVSPGEYEIDYPDFYILETEVTNAQFKAYLNATGKTKDDTVVLGIVRKREERRVFTTGDIPYSIEDAATIWRDGKYPDGLGGHPVALVTLHDATDFAEWVTRSSTEAGLIRLPTWNEWMIAAYGNSRNYPWGTDYWGYSHHATPRECDLGFRVVFDPTKNTELRKRPRVFKQNNRAWSVEREGGVESTPKQQAEPPDAPEPEKPGRQR